MRCSIYQPRTYRGACRARALTAYSVRIEESDLFILADRDITKRAEERLAALRQDLTGYIEQDPDFACALAPRPVAKGAPGIVRRMARAGSYAGVGPMAAVAGAISEAIARHLHVPGHDIVIENGGDIYAFFRDPLSIALYAGASLLSMKVGLMVRDCREGMSVCTSSGSVGHSLSYGNADAVTVVARSGALADAVATALANSVQSVSDIERVLSHGAAIRGVLGIAIIVGDSIGICGEQVALCVF